MQTYESFSIITIIYIFKISSTTPEINIRYSSITRRTKLTVKAKGKLDHFHRASTKIMLNVLIVDKVY